MLHHQSSHGGDPGDIVLYLPFTLSSPDIYDIAGHLKSSTMTRGIFNANLTVSKNENIVELKDGDSLFARVHVLLDSEYLLHSNNNGTTITIISDTIKRALQDCDGNIYFRIRLHLSDQDNPFIKSIHPTDKYFLSGYETIDYIDFRLNETRVLPEEISRKMNDFKVCHLKIKQVYFLLATNLMADFIVGHEQFHKCRLLENDIWKDYVKKPRVIGNENGDERSHILPNHMIIYQWNDTVFKKGSREIHEFHAFMKFKQRKSNMMTVLISLSIILVIAILGSFSANYIYDNLYYNSDKRGYDSQESGNDHTPARRLNK